MEWLFAALFHHSPH